jgi:FtsZ-interacting cell division protein ZipA
MLIWTIIGIIAVMGLVIAAFWAGLRQLAKEEAGHE